jgi:hypothetical protein
MGANRFEDDYVLRKKNIYYLTREVTETYIFIPREPWLRKAAYVLL